MKQGALLLGAGRRGEEPAAALGGEGVAHVPRPHGHAERGVVRQALELPEPAGDLVGGPVAGLHHHLEGVPLAVVGVAGRPLAAHHARARRREVPAPRGSRRRRRVHDGGRGGRRRRRVHDHHLGGPGRRAAAVDHHHLRGAAGVVPVPAIIVVTATGGCCGRCNCSSNHSPSYKSPKTWPMMMAVSSKPSPSSSKPSVVSSSSMMMAVSSHGNQS
mmetsp:Transcript_26843/g.46816  ORF Transcript_26843/g.46816 Transcript_26843/m.46816 type:complete len:216 (+) Transcript_26843:1196-1843(+)